MGLEIGIILAFVAMICWGFGDFFIQKSVRKIGDVEALALIGLIGTIGLLPFVWRDFSSLYSFYGLAVLILLGVVTFVVALFNFEALKKGKLSVIEVVFELELPVVIILGFIFFGEKLSLTQFFIIGFIFLGIILMTLKKGFTKNMFSHLERGVFLGIIGAVGMGFIDFLTVASSRQVNPLMAIWVPWIIFTLMCFFVLFRRGGFGKFVKDSWKFRWLVLFMGIFDTLAWLAYAFSTAGNEIGIITAITESYPAIGLFLGIWINKERVNWHQYLGAFLAVVASVTLGFLA